jgi:tetratricopeptide (TPR) repeat protein
LGDICQGQGRLEEAIAAYNLAIELNPNFCWSYNNLGDLLRDQKQWKEAAEAYEKAIELNRKFSWSHYNLGEVLVQQQKWDEAVVAYRFALQIQPDLPQVEEKLNDALHYRVKSNLNLALSYYRQAIERDPTDIESYTKALEIAPNEPELHAGLGTAWQRKRGTAKSH